jgi:hypothetical protein
MSEELKPCPFCNQAVVWRFNSMTGEKYVTHADWNSNCKLRPFYGTADEWNTRAPEPTDDGPGAA